MPQIKSAIKRMRQEEKRTKRNKVRKEKLKVALKKFKVVLKQENSELVQQELKTAIKVVDKAGKKGILHKNAVNRRKSRLAKAANKITTKTNA